MSSVRSKNVVNDAENDVDADNLNQIQEKIGKTENESLESTRRALRLLTETQDVGTKTAEELVRQGEKLNGIEENLGNINANLTATQRNLNQIKSVFGGLKNRILSFKYKKSASKESVSSSKQEQPEEDGQQQQAPSNNLKMFSDDCKGGDFAVITGSDREQELNDNLAQMSLGLKHLANLGLGMQREIDRQNPLLDRLNNKIHDTDLKIHDQNTQMKQIVNKKWEKRKKCLK